MKLLLKVGGIFLFFLLLAIAWLWYETSSFLNSTVEIAGRDILFDVPSGASPSKIARELYAKKLITSESKFLLLIRLNNVAGKLQAGRFILNSGWKPSKILDALVNGKALLHKVTIPEGLTWWQTGKILADEGFLRFDDFKDLIYDKAFLAHHGIPFASAEGFLMPDTYLLKKPDFSIEKDQSLEEKDKIWKDQARAVTGRLIDNFWRKSEKLWPDYQEKEAPVQSIFRPNKKDLKKIVTLASIVEKETAIDHERAKVAGVYANRLEQGMLLQADPTVIYGLGPEFKGQLSKSNLQDEKNPYNTYQNTGLPPGPISSFGMAALKAAIKPEKHEYLYFVAIRDGGEHKFSKTLEQHNLAVQEYRQQKRNK